MHKSSSTYWGFGVLGFWGFGAAKRESIRIGIGSLGNRNFNNAALFLLGKLLGHLDILANRNANIGQGLLFGLTLRPAAGQAGARDTETFVGLVKDDAISSHGSYGTPLLDQPATAL